MKIILLIGVIILMSNVYAIPKKENSKESKTLQGEALVALVEAYYQTYTMEQAKEYMKNSCHNGWYKIEDIKNGSIEGGVMSNEMRVNLFNKGKYKHIIFRCGWEST